MEQAFKHLICSPSLPGLGLKMMKLWNLQAYTPHTSNKVPLVILGMLWDGKKKVQIHKERIRKHKGPKILLFAGVGDATDERVLKFIKRNKIKVIAPTPYMYPLLEKYDIPYSPKWVPYQSYDSFKVKPLGRKIFLHLGLPSRRPKCFNRLRYSQVLKPLSDHYGSTNCIWVPNEKRLPMAKLSKLYEQSFVYIKPREGIGSLTMFEMGCMGRRTITYNHHNVPSAINTQNPFDDGKDLQEVINLINKEKSRIGKCFPSVAEKLKMSFQTTNQWLTLQFWKNIKPKTFE